MRLGLLVDEIRAAVDAHAANVQTAVGDALGRLLSTQGADVVREYYFNDHGAQIDRFANSLIAGIGLILAKGAGTTGVQSVGGAPKA